MQTEHAAPIAASAVERGGSDLTRAEITACAILAVLAVAGELGAFSWLATHLDTRAVGDLVIPIAMHLMSSAVAAFATVLASPYPARRPYRMVWSLAFLMNLATPMLGLLMVLSSRIGYAYRPKFVIPPLAGIVEPEFSVQRTSAQQRRKVGARVNVLDSRLAATERINAQLALQDAPGKISADLLRSLLTDPIEDIRLLAYGLLDGKEKKISQRILVEQDILKQAVEKQQIYAAHRRLAELNWELIYQRMVQGDMRKYSGEQSIKNARAALAIRPEDGGLWFLCARVSLALNRPNDAELDLMRAERLGIPAVQLLPYYAEMAFEKRDFQRAQASMRRLTEKPSSKALGAVYEFWI